MEKYLSRNNNYSKNSYEFNIFKKSFLYKHKNYCRKLMYQEQGLYKLEKVIPMSYETFKKTTTEHADIKPGQLRLILKNRFKQSYKKGQKRFIVHDVTHIISYLNNTFSVKYIEEGCYIKQKTAKDTDLAIVNNRLCKTIGGFKYVDNYNLVHV